MSLACGCRGGGDVFGVTLQVVAWRMTSPRDHHTVHMNVKVLSLNPHGPLDWWVCKKKAAQEEKKNRWPRAILSNVDTTLR